MSYVHMVLVNRHLCQILQIQPADGNLLTPDSIIRFGWDVKIKSMCEEEDF